MDKRRQILSLVRPGGGSEEGALEQLFRREYPGLVRYASRLVDATDAEDVVQDAFVKYLRQRERQRLRARAIAGERESAALILDGDGIHARLIKAVFDEAMDRKRAQRRESRLLQLVTGPSATVRRWMSARRPAESADLRETIAWAVSRLPDYLREPWILVVQEGLTTEEGAATLGITPESCRAAICKANRQLRDRLRRHGVTLDILGGRDE